MLNYGGHIGYTVRPTERCKGYATQMLHRALEHCRDIGLERVLLTCDPKDIASCRTIEKCNGIMENEIQYENTDELVRRYWIDILEFDTLLSYYMEYNLEREPLIDVKCL